MAEIELAVDPQYWLCCADVLPPISAQLQNTSGWCVWLAGLGCGTDEWVSVQVLFGVSTCREAAYVSSSPKMRGHECDFLEVETKSSRLCTLEKQQMFLCLPEFDNKSQIWRLHSPKSTTKVCSWAVGHVGIPACFNKHF